MGEYTDKNGTVRGTPAQIAEYQRLVAENAAMVAKDAARAAQWKAVKASYERLVAAGHQATLDHVPMPNDYTPR